MPRLSIDYSRTFFYKICCKNTDIQDVYVGHTTNWYNRLYTHKTKCNKENNEAYNLPVYIFIRNNGGWDNFEMVLIEEYSCENKLYATQRERYWVETLHATLNSYIPSRTKKEYYEENKEYLQEKKKEYNEENREEITEKRKIHYDVNRERLLEEKKDYYEENREKILEKKKETIVCECGVEVNKSHLARHRRTTKHLKCLENNSS